MTADGALVWVGVAALAVALAATAGLRAWLPLLAAGVGARLGVIRLGEHFQVLGSTPALAALSVATVLELAADKVPVLDHALDVVSTVIRPLAGAVVAASAFSAVSHPLVAVLLGVVVGAPVAAAPHVAKSGARALSTASTAGLANPVVSVVEDVLAVVMAVLAVLVPVLAVCVAVAFAYLLWRLWRAMRPKPKPAVT